MTIREQLEAREREILSPHATLACATRGRQNPEKEHDYRTAFQRDRDRIIHAKAFRRLKRKTQVFLAAESDHYRTRLTHTLEVSQIARTVARALFLNEDLTEAIALGHDLGHTPFGHAGEATLDEAYEPGFNHYEQSLRVVDVLETRGKGPGLNLTWEVRDGIVSHSRNKVILEGKPPEPGGTLEGQIVSVCDAIAYVGHDIDDAIRGGLITVEDLPKDAVALIGRTTSERINTMVMGLIEGSCEGLIGITPATREAIQMLRSYLFEYVYPCDAISREIDKAKKLVRELYRYLLEHPEACPSEGEPGIDIERRVVDFIASMTDNYALHLFERLFFPTPWNV